MVTQYQQRILEAVHQIRVNPLDDTLRLMLADLMEEGGRQGIHERVTRHIRNDRMVLNSLDIRAVMMIRRLYLIDHSYAWLVSHTKQVPNNVVVQLEVYRSLWAGLAEDKDRHPICDKEVLQEANRVYEDRKLLFAGVKHLPGKTSVPMIMMGELEDEWHRISTVADGPT